MSEPIIELEMRLAYQEKTIDELNDAVYDQQKQIDRLEKQVETLQREMKMLIRILKGDEGGNEADF